MIATHLFPNGRGQSAVDCLGEHPLPKLEIPTGKTLRAPCLLPDDGTKSGHCIHSQSAPLNSNPNPNPNPNNDEPIH